MSERDYKAMNKAEQIKTFNLDGDFDSKEALIKFLTSNPKLHNQDKDFYEKYLKWLHSKNTPKQPPTESELVEEILAKIEELKNNLTDEDGMKTVKFMNLTQMQNSLMTQFKNQ